MENRQISTKRCIIDECPNSALFRGLCRRCHQNARRAIARGDTTEEELLEKTLILPSVRGQRKRPPPWREAFERLNAPPDDD